MKLYRYARETKQATKQTSLYDSDIPKKKTNKQKDNNKKKDSSQNIQIYCLALAKIV